jgi:hypothetical protein
MPASKQETGIKTRTERRNSNTPEVLKHLKPLMLGTGGDGAGDEFQGPGFGVEVEVASEADQLPVIFPAW